MEPKELGWCCLWLSCGGVGVPVVVAGGVELCEACHERHVAETDDAEAPEVVR